MLGNQARQEGRRRRIKELSERDEPTLAETIELKILQGEDSNKSKEVAHAGVLATASPG